MLKEKEIINSKIGVVAHDSGGAYYIKSFIDHHMINAFYYVEGPSIKIFGEINNSKCKSLDEIIAKSDILIFGTGWETKFEIQGLIYAKKSNIRTISFLDHWTNYKERFILNGKINLPDLLIVFDSYAINIARETFPKSQKILRIDNYYILNQIKDSVNIKSSENYILFIDEPLASHKNSEITHNFTENDALSNFLSYIKDTKFKNEKVLIRMHPSEKNSNKYKYVIRNKKCFCI